MARYPESTSWLLTAGRSQPASILICADLSLDASQLIQVAAASFLSLFAFTTRALLKKWVAFCVPPGSTQISHAKSQPSVKVANAQIPVGIMPRRPLWNKSQSPMPPICSSFGCTFVSVTLLIIISAAVRFSGELMVKAVLSSFKMLPPYCAATLKNSLKVMGW